MSQKDDKNFVELLSEICLGCITNEDIKTENETYRQNRVREHKRGRAKISKLPSHTVCLLPMKNMCNQINKEMLCILLGDEIWCITSDTIDRPRKLMSRVSKMLLKCGDHSTNTAGLEKEIII